MLGFIYTTPTIKNNIHTNMNYIAIQKIKTIGEKDGMARCILWQEKNQSKKNLQK